MELQKSSLLGLPVSQASSMSDTLRLIQERLSRRQSCIVSFVNPYAFHLRWRNQAYANALWQFDMILPDGIAVVKALRWINGITVERQSFDATSLFQPVFCHLSSQKKSLCLVGGRPGVAGLALHKMRQSYPGIDYRGVIDGFQPFEDIVNWVKSHEPDVVLVGMGAPIQESLLLRLKYDGFRGVGFTCGGFLDQYVVGTQYYPAIIDRLDLRWLYRLVSDPRRLGRRYLIQYQTFVFDVLWALIGSAIGRRFHESHLWQAGRYASLENR